MASDSKSAGKEGSAGLTISPDFRLVFDRADWTGNSAIRVARLMSRSLSSVMHGGRSVTVEFEDHSRDTREGQMVLSSFQIRSLLEYLKSQQRVKSAIDAAFRDQTSPKRTFWAHAEVSSLWLGSTNVKRAVGHRAVETTATLLSRFVVIVTFETKAGARSRLSCLFEDAGLVGGRKVV